MKNSATSTKNDWYTEEEDRKIIRLRVLGKTYQQIADALPGDRTENGVRHRLRKLKGPACFVPEPTPPLLGVMPASELWGLAMMKGGLSVVGVGQGAES